MTLRLALFDVDGTLVDSQDSIVHAMTHAFAGEGLTCPARAELLAIVGLSLPQAMARLVPGGNAALHDRLVAGYRAAFLQARQTEAPPPLYDGIRAVLDDLHARDDVLLGVATGKARRGLDHLCAAHDLTGLFLTRQTADDHPSKPHPAMVLAALSETGVAPENAVMVGDTSFDMQMGRDADVRTLAVSWGYHDRATLTGAKPDAIIDRVAALPEALDRLWGDA